MTHPTVTQADRELAADLMDALFTGAPDLEGDLGWASVVRNGEDDEYPIVQAIARHRTATEASTAARIAALEGENGKLRRAVDGWRIQHERLRESLEVARARVAELEEGPVA